MDNQDLSRQVDLQKLYLRNMQIIKWRLKAVLDIRTGKTKTTYKMTNIFLLTHCTYSYELFHIHSEEQYRLLHELKRMFDHTEMNADSNADPVYQIDDAHSIWVHEGCFEVLNADGNRLLEPIRISEFARHPREYFNLIAGKIKE